MYTRWSVFWRAYRDTSARVRNELSIVQIGHLKRTVVTEKEILQIDTKSRGGQGTCSVDDAPDEAETVLVLMKEAGVRLKLRTYSPLLIMLCRRGSLAPASQQTVID